MDALAAARVGDEVAHGFGLAAMVAGAVVGALAGAAVVGAMMLTGGLAAVVIAGAIAGGGIAGGQILAGLNTIFNLPEPTSGVLAIGSPDVFTNRRPAIRALLSYAGGCSGQPFNHPPLPISIPVVEGSISVMINKQPASRLKSKLMCGSHIKSGSPNVVIGGETTRVGFVFDLEAWFKTGLEVLGFAALIGGALFAVAAGVAASATFLAVGGLGFAAFEGVGMIGDALGPGYRDLLQGIAGMGLVVAGPRMARGVRPAAAAADDAATARPSIFQPKKVGQTEPGVVPNTPKLQAEMDAAALAKPRSAAGYPDLPAGKAATFGDDVRPWNGDEHPGPIRRVIGRDEDANGGFWQADVPTSEAEWRGGSAVLNDWNGNGGYVESSTAGLRGWIGSARPQMSSDGASVLPGHGQQIWIPPGSASPGLPIPTPWSIK